MRLLQIMITKKELNETLQYEYSIYFSGKKDYWFKKITKHERYLIYEYIKLLRLEEYHIAKSKSKKIYKYIGYLYTRKKNILGCSLNMMIYPFMVGRGINIHHKGVIINGKCGNDCVFHGNCCIGKKHSGDTEEMIPHLSNNCDVGIGSIILGDISIAEGVTIGANSVVVSSIDKSHSIWVGSPAKIIC